MGALVGHPEDTLLLGGDCCESEDQLDELLALLGPRFRALAWVPGNHELWTQGDSPHRGRAKYERMVAVCERRGVATPESGPIRWVGDGVEAAIALLWTGFDYSFVPDEVPLDRAVDWAREHGILCLDEFFLHTEPWPDRGQWAEALRVDAARTLDALPTGVVRVAVNHWPFRRDLVRIPRVPRFLPWCGSRATEAWHRRYALDIVVSGHLHVRATDWRDQCRFEEVSLGYPRHWKAERGAESYVREILPFASATGEDGDTRFWR